MTASINIQLMRTVTGIKPWHLEYLEAHGLEGSVGSTPSLSTVHHWASWFRRRLDVVKVGLGDPIPYGTKHPDGVTFMYWVRYLQATWNAQGYGNQMVVSNLELTGTSTGYTGPHVIWTLSPQPLDPSVLLGESITINVLGAPRSYTIDAIEVETESYDGWELGTTRLVRQDIVDLTDPD